MKFVIDTPKGGDLTVISTIVDLLGFSSYIKKKLITEEQKEKVYSLYNHKIRIERMRFLEDKIENDKIRFGLKNYILD